VVRLVDENGTPVAYYEYDAWGSELRDDVVGGTGTNRFRYQSNWIKSKDGPLYISPTRIYDPELGRLLGRDPRSGLSGTYEYATDSPVRYVDPNGRQEGDTDAAAESADIDLSPGELKEIARVLWAQRQPMMERRRELLEKAERVGGIECLSPEEQALLAYLEEYISGLTEAVERINGSLYKHQHDPKGMGRLFLEELGGRSLGFVKGVGIAAWQFPGTFIDIGQGFAVALGADYSSFTPVSKLGEAIAGGATGPELAKGAAIEIVGAPLLIPMRWGIQIRESFTLEGSPEKLGEASFAFLSYLAALKAAESFATKHKPGEIPVGKGGAKITITDKPIPGGRWAKPGNFSLNYVTSKGTRVELIGWHKGEVVHFFRIGN
jgi:RHS repeat-associated protein